VKLTSLPPVRARSSTAWRGQQRDSPDPLRRVAVMTRAGSPPLRRVVGPRQSEDAPTSRGDDPDPTSYPGDKGIRTTYNM